ncbi:hypothetical protein SB861_03320 [Paraburkholderia sp. SIMBA_049]
MNDRPSKISLDLEDVAKLKFEAARGRPYANRISLVLALRLLDRSTRHLDPTAVLRELDYLEGLEPTSRTKAEAPFRGSVLRPLWHKHFTSARHVVANIGIRWNLPGGGNKDLDRTIAEINKLSGAESEDLPNRLVHRLVLGGYEERVSRGLTGDWIVYGRHAGANYYLDLATHEEGSSEEAAKLLAKLRNGCFWEYPFVFDDQDSYGR